MSVTSAEGVRPRGPSTGYPELAGFPVSNV